MRLKKQVGEHAHGSQIDRWPCGVFLSKEHESPMKASAVGGRRLIDSGMAWMKNTGHAKKRRF